MWLLYYRNFERSYDVLKSKSSCILLNKNINFNKNGMELEIILRDEPCASAHVTIAN